jgi:hypothetical protein
MGDPMRELVVAATPVGLLIIVAAWAIVMTRACKFQRVSDPRWPFAENPGLALELADSLTFVDLVPGGR